MRTLKDEVEAFLFAEADICDNHRYTDWLGLWAEDSCYWIPCNDDDSDPATHVAIAYETYSALEDRVHRLSSGHVHSQSPRTRLNRIVGNVCVNETVDGLVDVNSVVHIIAFRRDVTELLGARIVHQLRRHGESFRIVRKTVYLANNDGYQTNLTFLL
ncbi:aromatic-ring-hydroxylating dioxygenase subunit beta [Paraburkholderia phytofirmans]|uniref:aromatic-ring-hydroxylating dioxygenase subunit beta n=1 Tax=Paraburkholderia phytofirmans TaxID=261302 RepID=UPI0038BCA0DD